MCRVCCLSLQSGCLFGASAHIVDALLLGWVFAFDVVSSYYYYWAGFLNDPYLVTHQALIGVYIAIYLVLGCIIFRGIQMGWPRLILGCTAAFFLLQFIAFIICLVWWYPIPEPLDDFGLLESARIGRFVIRCLATVAYVVVLAFYARKLTYEDQGVFKH